MPHTHQISHCQAVIVKMADLVIMWGNWKGFALPLRIENVTATVEIWLLVIISLKKELLYDTLIPFLDAYAKWFEVHEYTHIHICYACMYMCVAPCA